VCLGDFVLFCTAAYRNAVREQKLATELRAAAKERDFYLQQVGMGAFGLALVGLVVVVVESLGLRVKGAKSLIQDSGFRAEGYFQCGDCV